MMTVICFVFLAAVAIDGARELRRSKLTDWLKLTGILIAGGLLVAALRGHL